MKAHFRVLLLWLGLGCSAFGANAPRTIVFFGDSLTAGYGLDDPETESYPAIIQQKLEAAHLSWRAVNAGLSGETTSAGLRRVDWILRQHVDIFVLALGGNDGLRGIEPSVSAANLEAIIQRVRAKYPDAKIVIAGLQMPPTMGEEYGHAFSAIFPAVAEKSHATLIPFLLADVGGHSDLNQPDGIHPTAAGATKVAETVWAVLHPLL
ncbi:MAG: lipolytic protein family [Verrucomicrobia bacterium]|nr:lipolytic protein family [Verrucomicrobiota bacterium]